MPHLVVANWKMNGTRSMAHAYLSSFSSWLRDRPDAYEPHTIVICPPFHLLAEMHKPLKDMGLSLGAQNMYPGDYGAVTGDINAGMLRDVGVDYVILGHSERRTLFGETNPMVREKLLSARDYGLCPILCVGESADDHAQGRTVDVVMTQLDESTKGWGKDPLVIAYEPVWAIGTGLTPTLDGISHIHHALATTFGPQHRYLYGGSVKPSNAKDIAHCQNVHGCLVGGASLNPEDFIKIIEGFFP